ncbi:DUF6338 family protein [Pseudomonas helleri]|uniref:Uncharacterized protein n=1 Tax=Pseudomonas helleri TaxID=1608996 RepID=A0A7X1Y836_9PSED|nr:DUF6338 family protein [Pseudomonas helleri]MQT96943.1 hypothetical protein [Pseudomonas helleri]MQU32171.1 hypothetical protein [Pseudomonas helleri]
MEGLSAEVIPILEQLMPGFLAMIVFYWFAETPKPAYFEKILQALITTAVIQVLVAGTERLCYLIGDFYSIGQWSETSTSWVSIVFAIVIGLALAYLCNNDIAFSLARKLGLTTRASQGDAIHIYKQMAAHAVIIHFIDGRRMMGYIDAFPNDRQTGIYLISSPHWIKDDAPIPSPQTHSYMIHGADVRQVEFLN